MHNLFVYGTLMFDQVRDLVISDMYSKTSAVLTGYARYTVTGETYPGLIEQTGASLDGILLFDLTDESLAKLDTFEGHHYHRIQVNVIADGSEMACETYEFSRYHLHLLSDKPWTPEYFETHHLQRFLTTLA